MRLLRFKISGWGKRRRGSSIASWAHGTEAGEVWVMVSASVIFEIVNPCTHCAAIRQYSVQRNLKVSFLATMQRASEAI